VVISENHPDDWFGHLVILPQEQHWHLGAGA